MQRRCRFPDRAGVARVAQDSQQHYRAPLPLGHRSPLPFPFRAPFRRARFRVRSPAPLVRSRGPDGRVTAGGARAYTAGMDREALIERVRELLEPQVGLVAAYLFGSEARGTARPRSDVDVAVLYDEPPPAVLGSPPMRLEADLERALRRPVQVVCLNGVPPDLGKRVLRDGILLVERDRGARIRFEVKLRNEYWDLEPILRACRRQEPTTR